MEDAAWCRTVCLALLHEVHDLPADAPVLTASGDIAADELAARVELVVRSVIGALGGSAA